MIKLLQQTKLRQKTLTKCSVDECEWVPVHTTGMYSLVLVRGKISCRAAPIPLRSLHVVWVNVEILAIAQVLQEPWNMQSNFSQQLSCEAETSQILRYISSFIRWQCICLKIVSRSLLFQACLCSLFAFAFSSPFFFLLCI